MKVTLVPFNQSRRLSHTRSPAELAREEQAFYEEYAEPRKLALGGWVPVSLVLILFLALVEISYAFH